MVSAWRELLETEKWATISLPWIGGKGIGLDSRIWMIEGSTPEEHCWATFSVSTGRRARFEKVCDPEPKWLRNKVTGYLVGDRLILNTDFADPDPKNIVVRSERVHLIEPGLDRFVLISAGRTREDGPLIYAQQEMPLGPEEEVQSAFLDGKASVADIRNVTPALDAAFRMAVWQKAEVERRRKELEERLRKEEEERQREARRKEIAEKLGDSVGRRELAKEDFEAAARAALAVGGAEYLDHRKAVQRNEMIVRFRFLRRRFECTCDRNTLQIIDSGICLTAHGDDEFADGIKGDSFFSLESLPSVISEADREGKLVVYRHVD